MGVTLNLENKNFFLCRYNLQSFLKKIIYKQNFQLCCSFSCVKDITCLHPTVLPFKKRIKIIFHYKAHFMIKWQGRFFKGENVIWKKYFLNSYKQSKKKERKKLDFLILTSHHKKKKQRKMICFPKCKVVPRLCITFIYNMK